MADEKKRRSQRLQLLQDVDRLGQHHTDLPRHGARLVQDLPGSRANHTKATDSRSLLVKEDKKSSDQKSNDFLRKRVKPFFKTFQPAVPALANDFWLSVERHNIRTSCLQGYSLLMEQALDGSWIYQVLGEGEFGAVYRVQDPKGNVRAMKISVLKNNNDIVLFNQEVRAGRRLAELDLGPVVFDAWTCHAYSLEKKKQQSKRWLGFIVMELVPGITVTKFRSIFKDADVFLEKPLTKLDEQWEAHDKEWEHGDLNNDNILVDFKTSPFTSEPYDVHARTIDFMFMTYRGKNPTYKPRQAVDMSRLYRKFRNKAITVQVVCESMFAPRLAHHPTAKQLSIDWHLTTQDQAMYFPDAPFVFQSPLTKAVLAHYDGQPEQPIVKVGIQVTKAGRRTEGSQTNEIEVTDYTLVWENDAKVRQNVNDEEFDFLGRLGPKCLCYLVRLAVGLGYITQKSMLLRCNTKRLLLDLDEIYDLKSMGFREDKTHKEILEVDVRTILRGCRPFRFFH